MNKIRALTLFRCLHSLRHGLRLTQVLPSCTLKEFKQFSYTSWPPRSILKLRDLIKSASYQPPASVKYLSIQLCPTEDDILISKTILSLERVEKQLEFFESTKDSISIGNRVTMLETIGKITKRDKKQKRVLEQEKTKSVKSSLYLALLDSISKDISKCQPRDLSNVLWALGKFQEKDHELVRLCERAILSHDILAFSYIDISKIVNGCVNLNLTTTEILSSLQESICNGQLKISDFNNWLLSDMLMLYAKTKDSRVELFHIFLEEILSRDLLLMSSIGLTKFVWSFAKKGVKADKLFDRVEEEILRRGTTSLKRRDLILLPWAFSKSRKGNQQFFNILENEIVARAQEGFDNADLLDLAFSFASRNYSNSKVFKLVSEEVLNRGVHVFKVHQLIFILMSFVSAQRHDHKLVKEIENELLSKDVKTFSHRQLSQIAWSLGRAKKSDSKFFSVIEEEVFQRDLNQFSEGEKVMLLRGYSQARRGSTQFYERLQSSF